MRLLIRYIGGGAMGAVTNIVVFYVLTHFLSVWYLVASTCSFLVALAVSFVAQKFFTFRDHSTDTIMKQAGLFTIVSALGLVLNVGILYVLVDVAGLHHFLGQIITMILVAIFSFVLYEQIVFQKGSALQDDFRTLDWCQSIPSPESMLKRIKEIIGR